MDELEELILEKDQEIQRLELTVSKLQGEVSGGHSRGGRGRPAGASGSPWVSVWVQVSGKLIDKERSLEDEIQLRERLQLQVRQAERTVDDLTLELQATNHTKDDLTKQLKTAQVPED